MLSMSVHGKSLLLRPWAERVKASMTRHGDLRVCMVLILIGTVFV